MTDGLTPPPPTVINQFASLQQRKPPLLASKQELPVQGTKVVTYVDSYPKEVSGDDQYPRSRLLQGGIWVRAFIWVIYCRQGRKSLQLHPGILRSEAQSSPPLGERQMEEEWPLKLSQ